MYYLIGIKGTGMAALAIMLKQIGEQVSGSDIDKPLFTELELIKNNIPILSFNPANIKDGMQVIVGNAFSEEHEEVKAALANKT